MRILWTTILEKSRLVSVKYQAEGLRFSEKQSIITEQVRIKNGTEFFLCPVIMFQNAFALYAFMFTEHFLKRSPAFGGVESVSLGAFGVEAVLRCGRRRVDSFKP